MVCIKWNKETIEVENGRIKKPEILEKKLKKLGWNNLRWCPSGDDEECRWELMGCPPNYDGPYGDYYETAIKILAVPKKPWEDSGEILARDVLHRQINYNIDAI